MMIQLDYATVRGVTVTPDATQPSKTETEWHISIEGIPAGMVRVSERGLKDFARIILMLQKGDNA